MKANEQENKQESIHGGDGKLKINAYEKEKKPI